MAQFVVRQTSYNKGTVTLENSWIVSENERGIISKRTRCLPMGVTDTRQLVDIRKANDKISLVNKRPITNEITSFILVRPIRNENLRNDISLVMNDRSTVFHFNFISMRQI